MPSLVPAANRTMAVFEIFAREKRELSNSDMARLLSLADSSCSDLLHTLHSLGYLMRTPKTRRFYPTGRLYETARQISQNDALTAVAQEAVSQLIEKTDESAFFGVLETSAVKIAAAQASRRPLRYMLDVGERIPLNSSALGKALLGLLPPERLRAEVMDLKLEPITPGAVVDRAHLISQIELGRQQGWYEARGEASEGATGLAVSGWVGSLPVALSLGGPTVRIERNRESYLRALREVRDTLLSDN